MKSRKIKLRTYVSELIDRIERTVWNSSSNESIVLKSIVKTPIVESESFCHEVYSSTISLLQSLYDKHDHRAHKLKERYNTLLVPDDDRFFAPDLLLPVCHGKLKGILNDIDNDLIGDLESQISSEIFGNFLLSAAHALDEGNKEFSAVLASAALEDVLKKIGALNGLDVRTKTIEKVVGILVGKKLLKGSSSKLLDKYIFIRNKALHAEWDKFQTEEVSSMIAFIERLLLEHFGTK
ncbi:MAG: hypothetical protein KIS94_01705 [Chitinophagales bacterium]|nr:hypothetical protein [Chitinophagales bacterium]